MNKKSVLAISLYVLFSGLLQLVLYNTFGAEAVEKLYPLIIHFPVIIFFSIIFKKRYNLVLFALLVSFIFTAPRRWIGDVVASFFNNDQYILILTKILASIILLIVINVYLRPFINRILTYSNKRINLLIVVPAISYIITYSTTVYTDALYESNMLVVGLFSVGFNCVFYTFIIAYFIEMDKSFVLQTEQTVLEMQIDTIAIQIEDYKESQKQGVIYRHDLRHHLQYISSCINENHTEEALNYISRINKNIESTYVSQYCENNSVNLILSTFAAKAKNRNTKIEIEAAVPIKSNIEPLDICVILSNGLENAIHATNKLGQGQDRKISVRCLEKNNKLAIEIRNKYEGEIQFEEDIPISTEKDHGLGVKSIILTVNKYEGLYSFAKDENTFIMQVIL